MIRAIVISLTLLLGIMPSVNASPRNQGSLCFAKVLKSEEFAYAPMGYWLVRVTFEITPLGGPSFETSLQDTMTWQGTPPREGQTFRLRCDRGLHLDFVKNRIVNYLIRKDPRWTGRPRWSPGINHNEKC
jgi:hypothetical protein